MRAIAFAPIALTCLACLVACSPNPPNPKPDASAPEVRTQRELSAPDVAPRETPQNSTEQAKEEARGIDCPDCTILKGGMIFDGSALRRGTVVLQGEKIKAVHWKEVAYTSGKVIDATGQSILPGLIDLHVHTPAQSGPYGFFSQDDMYGPHFKAMLRAGVTSYLDLGTSARTIFEYRQRLRDGKLHGPSMFAVGPLVTASGGHPCQKGSPAGEGCLLVDKPSDASQLEQWLFPQKPDIIKVVLESGTPALPLNPLQEGSLKAIQEAVSKAGLRSIAHVSKPADVDLALAHGIRLFGHIPSDGLLSEAQLKKLVDAKAIIIPTLVVLENLMLLATKKLTLTSDMADDVPADVLTALQNPSLVQRLQTPAYQQWITKSFQTTVENFKRCLKAGVGLAVGTDAGNPGTFHGLAVHREIALFVEHGMNPLQAIAAATHKAREVLKVEDRGKIAPGMLADLLVVRGDISKDLKPLAQIVAVYRKGKAVDREALSLRKNTSLILKATTGRKVDEVCLGNGECTQGLVCDLWYSRCTQTCVVATRAGCPKGSACFSYTQQDKTGFCLKGDGCDLFKQDCKNDTACIWLGNGATQCWSAGDKLAGQACDPGQVCAVGHQCNGFANKCYKLCLPGDTKICGAFSSCQDLSHLAGLSVGQCQ